MTIPSQTIKNSLYEQHYYLLALEADITD